MSTNIEIENKALISKDEYQKLINYYSKYNCTYIEQTNYYIDTINKDLIRLGLSLRIRNIANDYELTLKQKLKEGLLEINQVIKKQDFDLFEEKNILPNGEILEIILKHQIEINKLQILASLATSRLELKLKEGLLAIDKNMYNSNTDYEIELESTSLEEGDKSLKQILNNLGIEYIPNSISKQKRALNSIKY